MPLRVSVAVGSKKADKPPVEIDLPSRDATVKALKEAFYRKLKLHPTRQSYKYVNFITGRVWKLGYSRGDGGV